MEKLKVFMVMPFSDDVANNNYLHSIKPVCDKFNLEVRRADEIFSTSPIYEDIVKEIQEASIIIVDITNKNPNVFYELGMAHTLKQNRTIMVTQDSFKEMPFDIAHFRIIPYENTIVGKVNFEKQLQSTLKNLLSDRKETFKDEFELTFDIFLSSGNQSDLFGLVGIKKYKGTLTSNERVHMEGKYPDGESANSSVSLKNSFKTMEKLDYVKYENDIIMLTEKGNAFVEYLLERGVDCFQFNDQIFADNYVPLFERRRQSNHS
jgi:hypothetical protein